MKPFFICSGCSNKNGFLNDTQEGEELKCEECSKLYTLVTKNEDTESLVIEKVIKEPSTVVAKKPTFNDLPIDGDEGQDFLNWDGASKKLASFICNRITPITIGVQGDWGSGKTSFINMVKKNLGTPSGDPAKFLVKDKTCSFTFYETQDGEDKNLIITLDINAWIFNKVEDVSMSMMTFIYDELTKLENFPKNPSDFLKDIYKKSLGFLGVVISSTSEKAGEIFQTTFMKKASESSTAAREITFFRKNLDRSMNKVIENITASGYKKVRFIIFIDDLDRIPPKNVFQITEALKLFLDLNGCVFVLHCDMEVIKKGISASMKEYGNSDVSDSAGKNYLDKIIQIIYEIPKPSINGVRDIISSTYTDYLSLHYGNGYEEILNLFPDVRDNIRSLKKVANSYELNIHLLEGDAPEAKNPSDLKKMLFFLGCLYQFDLEIFNEIYDAINISTTREEDKYSTDFNKMIAYLLKQLGFKENGGKYEVIGNDTHTQKSRSERSLETKIQLILEYMKENEVTVVKSLYPAFIKSMQAKTEDQSI